MINSPFAVAMAFLIVVGLSYLITCAYRRIAIQRDILDHPNHRSSHTIPTPRGGGVSIVVCSLAVLAIAAWEMIISESIPAIIVAGAIVALIGLWDDLRSVSAAKRFIVHLGAATLGVMLLPAPLSISLLGYEWEFQPLLLPLAIIGLVWMTNLYNFMDGIDGIAGIQAITVYLGAAVLLGSVGAWGWVALMLLLSASVVGFLLLNWPPAKIFMGDAASGFLGILIGMLALASSSQGVANIWAWLILMSLFIVDATWTLMVRLYSGQRWSQPHRSHLYQILSRAWRGHKPVTIFVGGVNVLWFLPLAYLSILYPAIGVIIALLGWAPVIYLCWHYKAGMPSV